jgi:hypothetical protein
MANTKSKENSRSYDDIKKSIINKVEAIETNQNEIKDLLNEAIKVLREQGKDKKLIIERLKNDFVLPNFVGKSTVYNVVNYAFASDEQKQKIEEERKITLEKKRLMYQQVIAGGGSSQLLEEGENINTGSSNIAEEEEDDIHAQRQRAKDNQIVANVRKAGKQIQKMNPETIQGDAFNDDDDEEESDTYNDNDDDNTLSKARHEIVMDDQDILTKIATLLSENKTFTLIVDGNLKCLDVKEGIAFS